MSADPLNANPTILSAADLPTRWRRPSSHAHVDPFSALFSNSTAVSSHPSDPFTVSPVSLADSDSEDDTIIDRIDEQEIYEGPSCEDASALKACGATADAMIIVNCIKRPCSSLAYYSLLTATDLISSISDPEHPLSLGELAVVNLPDIDVRDAPTAPFSTVLVEITPTITHCSLATVIGLGVRVRLEQALPPRFRVDVRIKEGTHSTADQVNKQLNDKERVAAALENGTLMGVLNKMLGTCK